MSSSKIIKVPLRLRRREPPSTGIRRIAREQVEAACAELDRPLEPRRAVHEARKALKKLRAILQIVAPQFDRAACKTERQKFQVAARLLAPLRDAEARLHTLDELIAAAGFPPGEVAQVRAAFKADLARQVRGSAGPRQQARALLVEAQAGIRHWPLRGLKRDDLLEEIRRSYRKGRKALRGHQAEPTPEAFHAWRKKVKELWYHLRIAESFLPEAAQGWIEELEVIGEWAGKIHDLEVLRDTLAARKADAQTALLIGEIEVRLPECHGAAIERGLRFYAAKPRDFARRLTG